MAKKHVLSKEELRSPDKISEFFINLWKWTVKNRKIVGIVVLLIIIIASAISIFIYIKHKNNEEASRELKSVIDALARPITSDKTIKLTAGDRKPAKDVKTLLQDAYKIVKTQDCSNSDACYLRDLLRGRIALELSRQDSAKHKELLEDSISVLSSTYSKVSGFIKAAAVETLGQAKEEKGDLTGALEMYKKLATIAGGTYAGQSMLHQARILEYQGKTKEAISVYKSIVKTKSTNVFTTGEAKLRQMYSFYQIMATMKQGNEIDTKKNQALIQRRMFEIQQKLVNLYASASLVDAGAYAKQRLAFLDLGLDVKTKSLSTVKPEPTSDKAVKPVNTKMKPQKANTIKSKEKSSIQTNKKNENPKTTPIKLTKKTVAPQVKTKKNNIKPKNIKTSVSPSSKK